MAHYAKWILQASIPKEVSRAFDNLAEDENFAVILEWLRAVKEDGDKNYPGIDNDILYRWNQGASQVLNAILDTNDNARDILHAPEPKKSVPFRNP